ncbi:hypothetical protein Tco_0526146 [Tanacetum coccineum]
MMVQVQEEMGEGSANPTDPHHTPIITHPSTSQPQKKQKPRKPKRKDTEIPQSSSPTKPIADEAANEKNVHTHSNDPMLSGEDSLKLNNLMEIYQIATEVLDLENTKTAQAQEISSLKLREDPSKQGRKIDEIDQDAEVTLVDETHGRYDDPQMFDRDVFNGEEVFVAEQSEKSYEKYLILADNVQAMIEAVRLLAKRLQAREQEEVTDEEKARLFVELLKKRKKHFAALRAQEKRNKPPTKSQKKTKAEMAQESSSKRAVEELEQEIHRKGRNGYYEIMRADGSSKIYLLFSQLIKSFGREDLETLDQYGGIYTEKSIALELYDSCGIHFMRFKDMHVYMLVEKRYPLTPTTNTGGGGFLDKRPLDDLEVIAAKKVTTASVSSTLVYVSTARVKLVLLVKIKENILSSYYCLYTVNAAGTKLQLLKRLRLLKEFLLSRDG